MGGMTVTLRMFVRHKLQVVPSRFFMHNARTTWVTTESNNRIGLKLLFPSPELCEQCLRQLNCDANVTLLSSGTKNSQELVVLPHESAVETIEELLTDLKKNETRNFTILKHMRRQSKTIVEFGSPNIAKPLHMGHLRSAVTGNYIARIHKALHNDVHAFCFLGDWGTQFGLLQAGLAEAHSGESLEDVVQGMSLSDLLKYYVQAVKKEKEDAHFASEARRFCASLEACDGGALAVWAKIREKSVRHLDSVWKDLGINYDVMQGESEYTMSSKHTQRALSLMENSKIIQSSPDGTKFVRVTLSPKSGNTSRAILIKSDGSSLYILRDIAAAIHRKFDYGFDKMIYVVDNAQSSHFRALFDILHQMKITSSESPEEGPMLQHVSFGRVEGQSTRSGTFSLLEDVIRDGTDMMDMNRASSPHTRYKDDSSISRNLAISSLIINSLKVRRNKNIQFDWVEALRSRGDTGVSLQYSHARLVSLIQKQSHEYFDSQGELKFKPNYEYVLQDPIALDLALQMAKYVLVVSMATSTSDV